MMNIIKNITYSGFRVLDTFSIKCSHNETLEIKVDIPDSKLKTIYISQKEEPRMTASTIGLSSGERQDWIQFSMINYSQSEGTAIWMNRPLFLDTSTPGVPSTHENHKIYLDVTAIKLFSSTSKDWLYTISILDECNE